VAGGVASITVVGSLAESLAVFVSPPPETVAVFVTFRALLGTTVTVIAENASPAATAELVEQSAFVPVLLLQLQSAPEDTN
jgi:hypothetical protein